MEGESERPLKWGGGGAGCSGGGRLFFCRLAPGTTATDVREHCLSVLAAAKHPSPNLALPDTYVPGTRSIAFVTVSDDAALAALTATRVHNIRGYDSVLDIAQPRVPLGPWVLGGSNGTNNGGPHVSGGFAFGGGGGAAGVPAGYGGPGYGVAAGFGANCHQGYVGDGRLGCGAFDPAAAALLSQVSALQAQAIEMQMLLLHQRNQLNFLAQQQQQLQLATQSSVGVGGGGRGFVEGVSDGGEAGNGGSCGEAAMAAQCSGSYNIGNGYGCEEPAVAAPVVTTSSAAAGLAGSPSLARSPHDSPPVASPLGHMRGQRPPLQPSSPPFVTTAVAGQASLSSPPLSTSPRLRLPRHVTVAPSNSGGPADSSSGVGREGGGSNHRPSSERISRGPPREGASSGSSGSIGEGDRGACGGGGFSRMQRAQPGRLSGACDSPPPAPPPTGTSADSGTATLPSPVRRTVQAVGLGTPSAAGADRVNFRRRRVTPTKTAS